MANGASPDVLGGPLGAWIVGDGRDNILMVGGADSLIAAGSGNAILRGGSGTNFLFGGAGNNHMFGGDSANLMIGSSGSSHMIGGAGYDNIYAGNGTGRHILDGQAGINSPFGGDGADTFVVGRGDDEVFQFTIGQDRLDVSAFKVAGIAGLEITGDASGSSITDAGDVTHVFLADVDKSKLSAADFIFSNPPSGSTVSIAALAAKRPEGLSGATPFTFTLTRSGDTTGTASVSWASSRGSVAGTIPANGKDFANGVLPSGRVTFTAGQTSQVITLNVVGDTPAELNESFAITLSNVLAGVTLGTASATGIILNDDPTASAARTSSLSSATLALALMIVRVDAVTDLMVVNSATG